MIVIIEKSLDVLNGHEHTQIKAIRDLVPGREIGVVTHHEFSADEVPIGGRVSPVFSTNRETLHDPVGARARDVKTLCSLIEGPGVDAPVSFVVPSAYPHELRVGLEVLDRTDAARFHYRIIRPEVMAALEPSEIAAVGEAISQGKISLHTETRELSDHISDAYGLVADDNFLLPCTIDPEVDPVGCPGAGEGRTVRIGYLGNYRTEKGSESIPDILDALGHRVSALPGKTRLEIVVQWPARIQSKPRKLIYVIKIMAIAARHFPRGRLRIKWYRGGIPTDEFLTLLKSLDLVLVPYDPGAYRYRGSGIIIDAVLARRPLVVREGIGMKRHTQFGNAGAAEDSEEFAEEIIRMVAARHELGDNLEAARQDLLRQLDRTRAMLASLA